MLSFLTSNSTFRLMLADGSCDVQTGTYSSNRFIQHRILCTNENMDYVRYSNRHNACYVILVRICEYSPDVVRIDFPFVFFFLSEETSISLPYT